jgi:hypothetical protein
VVTADFNGDGKPDVAFGYPGNRYFSGPIVGVVLNTTPVGVSSASFAAEQDFGLGYPVGVRPALLAVGDFNGDGKPDILVNGSVILLNTTPTGASTPSFAAPQTLPGGGGVAAVGDFNGDGKPDIAVVNNGTVSILLNATLTGSSTVSFAGPQTFAVGTSPEALAVGDFDGDGRPDLAVVNNNNGGSGTVSVLLNTTSTGSSTVTFAAQQTFAVGTNPTSVAVADFNGDGKPDLAVGNYNNGNSAVSSTVSVLLNTTPTGSGTASFAAQQTFAVGFYGDSVMAADFNADGKPDIASVGLGGQEVSVLVNTTPALATTASFIQQTSGMAGSGGYDALAAGDFNSDGRPDLIASNGNGFSFVPATVFLNTSFSAVVGQFGGQGVWQYNNDTGAWAQLTGANATQLVADSFGDVAASFPGYGVWLFRQTGGGWQQINGIEATVLAMSPRGNIAAEFPGFGVGEYTPGGGWKLLTRSNATLLAVDAQGDVAGEFPHYGVELFQPASGWKQINGYDATLLAMDARGDIAAQFPDFGVGEYTGAGWTSLTEANASVLAMDANGDVAAEIPGQGVWLYRPASGWSLLTAANAGLLAANDGAVAGAFPGAGVWEFDPVRGWFKLTDADASLLAMA